MSKERLIVPGMPHHLWIRGNNRRKLFSYEWEYLEFAWLVTRAADAFACVVHALVLMTNHFHLLVTPPARELLSKFVQSFAQRYAQRRNARRDASGKLFEHPFDSSPVLDERYLANVTAYIELNPVRDGLCAHPGDWKWSTYNFHAGRPDRSKLPQRLWTPSDWYLSLGPEGYEQFVAEYRARQIEQAVRESCDIRVRRPDGTRAT
jgi:REP-associated tyrosine transposase